VCFVSLLCLCVFSINCVFCLHCHYAASWRIFMTAGKQLDHELPMLSQSLPDALASSSTGLSSRCEAEPTASPSLSPKIANSPSWCECQVWNAIAARYPAWRALKSCSNCGRTRRVSAVVTAVAMAATHITSGTPCESLAPRSFSAASHLSSWEI
jgi:hypothetical protein